jgi:hypothetical protein
MKQSLAVLTVISLFILVLSACRVVTGPVQTVTPPPSSQISATVDGKLWTPNIPFSSSSKFSFGGDYDSTEMKMVFSQAINDTGTYPIGYGFYVDAYFEVDSTYYDAASGSTHLTFYSPAHITGTFNFVGKDTKGDSVVITNGQYDVTF